MTEKTDRPLAAQTSSAVAPFPASAAQFRKKPRFALFVATAAGLGYLPKAPGTWGSLAAVGITYLSGKLWGLLWFRFFFPRLGGNANADEPWMFFGGFVLDSRVIPLAFLAIGIAVLGAWASRRASQFARNDDPQFVVIDEVSGQLITILLGTLTFYHAPPGKFDVQIVGAAWAGFGHGTIDWRPIAAGFVLFRLFDIWKPFPIRRLEKLPGGWGIMADDWMAGIYAAILMRLALHFNLL